MKLIRYQMPKIPSNRGCDWDALFDAPFRAFSPLLHPSLSPLWETARTHSANVEWYESDNAYRARLELPGVRREDLRLDVEDGLVRITVERKDEQTAEAVTTSRQENFEQVLRLPEMVQSDRAEARLTDGILELTLPKAAKPQTVSITVQ
jgi:HSP20 family molecular chaperone IbpA